MTRTNIEINERLVRRVMKLHGFKTKRDAVDYALRQAAGSFDTRDVLKLRGMGWEGDLDEMRRWEPPGGEPEE